MIRQALTFAECKEFARCSNVTSSWEWKLLVTSFKFPNCLPHNPKSFYGPKKLIRNPVSYEEAKKLVHPLKIRTRDDYHERYNEFGLEGKIPKSAEQYFRSTKEWKGWKDFLGYTRLTAQEIQKNAMPYKKLEKLVRKLGIKKMEEYQEWARTSKIKGVVLFPHQHYLHTKEWKSYPEFFDNYEHQMNRYGPFKEVRLEAQKLGIQTKTEWTKAVKADKIPKHIPKAPPSVYKKEWKGWPYWLGNRGKRKFKGHSPEGIKFWDYEKTKNYLRKRGIKSNLEFKKLLKAGKIPKHIPRWMPDVYEEWQGWPALLGTKRTSRKRGTKLKSFKEAKKWAIANRDLILSYGKGALRGYGLAYNDGKIPKDIPRTIDRYYKEWKGYNDFFGVEKQKWRAVGFKWLPYRKAKKIVQSKKFKTRVAFIQWAMKNNIKYKIPVNADKIYKKQWQGWAKFLDTPDYSFEDCRRFARSTGITRPMEWYEAHDRGFLPEGIPKIPSSKWLR